MLSPSVTLSFVISLPPGVRYTLGLKDTTARKHTFSSVGASLIGTTCFQSSYCRGKVYKSSPTVRIPSFENCIARFSPIPFR